MDVLTVTTGLPGAGKTYARGVRFVQEFLRDEPGAYISNLPIKPEVFAEWAGEDKAQSVLDRLYLIPESVEASWRAGESGPWDYFGDTDLTNAHIAIDEAHTVCGSKHPRPHKRKWQEFIGELRHRGATLELITQHPSKLASEVMVDAGKRLEVVNGATIPDPLFGVPRGDWWQFWAKLEGVYRGTVVQQTHRKGMLGKWKIVETRVWPLDPDGFRFYNSYAEPKNGGIAGRRQEPWERFGWLRLIQWFVFRNLENLMFKNPLIKFAAVMALCLGGAFYLQRDKPKKPVAVPMVTEPQKESPASRFVENVTFQPAEQKQETAVAAIVSSGVISRDGKTFLVGEKIDGKTILATDADSGLVFTNDGRLRIDTSDIVEDRSGVRNGVPSRGSSRAGGVQRINGTPDLGNGSRGTPRSAGAASGERNLNSRRLE